MAKLSEEIQELFHLVRTQLGAGVRSVELEDDQLCDLLKVSMSDYMERTLNAVIDNNWIGLYGKHLNSTEIAYALTMRTLDMSKEYGYWFSKQVGLQQQGPWEMKKDFIEIERGKQVYTVPAGRVINKVMYVNPPSTDIALFANYGGLGFGFMPGGQVGGGYMGGMMGGFYTMQAADASYLATDLTYKNRMLKSDLVYKVTAGPEGTHLIHLLSTPGSKLSFNQMGYANGLYGLQGCQVWYTYYDVASEEEADECMRYNADNVILSPDQVPMSRMDFAFLNEPSKAVVRQLLTAKAKQTLGLIRGKFSGKVNIPQAEMTLDYQMLIQQGNEEWKATMDRLDKRLERLRPANIMEENAKLVQQQLEIQKHTPLGIYTI